MNHTPGPWICRVGVINEYEVFVEDASNNCIAIVDSRGGLASTSEIRKNGNLIAAAPDLLEALKAVVEDGLQTNMKSWQERARAAIAKADGNQ